MTDALLKPGSTFQFRMSFFGGEVLEATARVIWSEQPRPGVSPASEIPHGLEFTDIGDVHHATLKRLLDAGAFGVKNAH